MKSTSIALDDAPRTRGASPNAYTLTLPWLKTARAWTPWNADDRPLDIYRYPAGILTEFEALAKDAGLTIHVTNDVRALPSYGDDVIAIVLEDEAARYPLYAHRVRAVFKSYGTSLPMPHVAGLDERSAVTLAHWLALTATRARFSIARRLRALVRARAVVRDIPLGYFKQLDLSPKPMSERRFDATFAGSIEHKSYPVFSPKRYLRSPKVLSRERMVANLERFAREHPECNVELRTTKSYGDSMQSSSSEYSERLRDTRICVVPRGASLETFRWFEGMRYGCVVVCERLPDRSYYRGAPCAIVRDWNELPALLAALTRDPARMESLGDAARKWWETRCSEHAVARTIFETISRP